MGAPRIQALDLPDDDPVGREVLKAREQALQAALESLAGDASPEADALRRECAPLLRVTGDLLSLEEPGCRAGGRARASGGRRGAKGPFLDASPRRDRRRRIPSAGGRAGLRGTEKVARTR
jgi:hypothetical protein